MNILSIIIPILLLVFFIPAQAQLQPPTAGPGVMTNVAAPSTPGSGTTTLYVDSTSKNVAVKNDAGTVNHGVQTITGVSHQWISAIAANGSATQSQPASSDVLGTTTNDDAAAGYIGEYATGTRASGSPTSLTNNTAANITSVSLTAGDWDVTGVVDYVATGATTSDFKTGVSSTSATFGSQDTFVNLPLITTALSDTLGHMAPVTRLSLSGTTTVYLVGQANFSLGTSAAYGTIRARRVR